MTVKPDLHLIAAPDLRRRSLLRLGMGCAAATAGIGMTSRTALAQHDAAAIAPPVQLTSTTLGLSVPTVSNAAVMVAGPADARTAQWARRLAIPLGNALRPGGAIAISTIGGRDGVTGANAFEALSNPDGSTALLVPGAAALAWLAGDPRVHFDAGRWMPALTSFGPAVLLGRTGPQPAALRVAASTPNGLELPALLGLSLLGAAPVPVFGLSDPHDAHAAFLDGRVDAILLTGVAVPQRVAALSSAQLRPLFALDTGPRNPALPHVPTLPELYAANYGRPPAGNLFDAWKATAAAARLDVALVLQPLTPASLVAQWRRGCSIAIDDPALANAAQAAQLSALPAPECVAALSAIVAGENTLLTLRRWIASHADWRRA